MLWVLLHENKDKDIEIEDSCSELIFGSLQNNSKEHKSDGSEMETENTSADLLGGATFQFSYLLRKLIKKLKPTANDSYTFPFVHVLMSGEKKLRKNGLLASMLSSKSNLKYSFLGKQLKPVRNGTNKTDCTFLQVQICQTQVRFSIYALCTLQ